MLDRTQQILLQMVKEIDTLCQANGIHYSIGGGTTIGAIRHGGFIPWDDDVDLYMTRDNWEKFIEVYHEGRFPVNRVLESCEFDEQYSNTFGRYVSTENAAVHPNQIAYDDPAGYVIDIFVFDPIMRQDMGKFLESYMLECDLINMTMGYCTRFDINIDRYPRYLNRKKREGLVPLVRELTGEIKALGKEGHDSYAMEWGSAPMLMSASIFDQGYTRVSFEDIEVESVRAYSEYLTYQFGDEWVYMPKADGIEGHEAIYSETIPYDVIREDFRACMDVEALKKSYIARKIKLLKANPARHKLSDYECVRRSIRARLELRQIEERQGVNINNLYEAENFLELSNVFARYHAVQLMPEMIGRLDRHSKQYRYFSPVSILLEDRMMKIALETLIRTERMSKAARLLDVYEHCEGRGEETLRLREEIDGTRRLIHRFSLARQSDYIELMKEVDEFLNQYPKNSQIMRLKIRLILGTLKYRKAGESAELIYEITEKLKTIFPIGTLPHGEIYKYEADVALLIEGDQKKARELYEYAYVHTTNGIIRSEIQCVKYDLGLELNESDDPWLELQGPEGYCADVSDEAVNALLKKEKPGQFEMIRLKINRRYYNRMIRKDDDAKEKAIHIYNRTGDRVKLLEQFRDKLTYLQGLQAAGEYEKLAEELAPHREAVERNYELGLGLMVHPVLSELQYELYRREGNGELAKKIDAMVPAAHRKPIGEQ